jgi:hypothetical protein
VSTFLTESTNVLAMSFEFTYEASVVPTEGGPPVDASLVVTGECSFDILQKSASDVRLDRVRLLDPEGALVAGKAISYLYGGARLGTPPKTWPYEFKVPLNPLADLTDLLRTIPDYDL